MTALRSLVFNGLFFAWSCLMFLVSLPALILPRAATQRCGGLWVRGLLWMLAAVCGLRHEIRGRENLPEGACIIASKHQSAWDTLIFSQILDDACYVMKRELLWVPLFGLYLMKSGVVPVDRGGGAGALRRMVKAARAMAAAGRPIVIYPEGTRVAPGKRRDYQPGVSALYSQLELPVVPVALNSGLFWGRRSFLKHPGRITLQFLPPIAPGLARKDFTAELARRLETGSEDLRKEAETVGTLAGARG